MSSSASTERIAVFEGPDSLVEAARTALYEREAYDLVAVRGVGAIAFRQQQQAATGRPWSEHLNAILHPVAQAWWQEEQGPSRYGCTLLRPVMSQDRHGSIGWHVDMPFGDHLLDGPLTISTRTDNHDLERTFSVFTPGENKKPSLSNAGHILGHLRDENRALKHGELPECIQSVPHEPDTAIIMINHPYGRNHRVLEAGDRTPNALGEPAKATTTTLTSMQLRRTESLYHS